MSEIGMRIPAMRTGLIFLLLAIVAAGCGSGSSGSDNAAPEAVFAASPDSGFAPLTVSFDASDSTDSNGTITSYAWTFGDETTGSGMNIQHTYQTAGTYTASLTVTDNGGRTDTQTRQIVVSASPPEADFTLSSDSGSAPLIVVFDASGSFDNDGDIVTYSWVFGDGTTGSGANSQHIYQTAGTYTAVLTVTDSDGLTDTRASEIVVAASPPYASFTVSTDSGDAPLVVAFDASGSSDGDGEIISYAWTFGDGETGSGEVVQHTYQTAGNYTAELIVTDNDGLTDTQYREISVSNSIPQFYTISGTVTSGEHMVSDSDVNDVYTTPVPNNSFAQAQVITAPVTVSGYVNVARAGEQGNSFRQGDTDDYYRVSLTGGMNISLYMVEDPDSFELNLYLYNNYQILRDSTVTDTNGMASLTVPQDGTYYLRVEADFISRAATGYALTIGLTGITAAQYPLRLSDDFVPGEILVRYEGEAAGVAAALERGPAAMSAMGFSTKAGAQDRDKLLARSDTVDKDVFFEKLGVKDALERSIGPGEMDSETRAKMETLWMVRAARRQSDVLFAEPNYIRRPLLVPDDVHYHYQWHYPLINLPNAWDITTGSSDVVVAVVDTGVLLGHPDLEGQLVSGYDFISDVDTALDGDGIDADPDDPGDQDSVEGSSFHGTHVAGTIAAASDNGKGVAGIAWNARIMPLRVLGKGGGTTSDIIQAVKYAAGLSNASGTIPDEPVDIINLSLGGGGYSRIEANVYAAAREQGVIVVAAAGNDGSSTPTYPAAYDDVVSVSAVAINESLASYSNYGATVDVAAPGGSSTDANGDGYPDGVLSSTGDDGSGTIEMIYAFSTGTSMATPHVSGVAALMRSLYPGLTPLEFDTLLAGGYLTQDIGDSGRDDQFGYGLIDAYKAVLVARDGGMSGGLPPLLSASPTILNYGISLNVAQVVLKNGGGGTAGELYITDYSTDASWLSVTPSDDVDEFGLGTYTATVNRDELSGEKTYTGTVSFDSNMNRIEVSVVVQEVSEVVTTNGGYHFILLVDPDTYETIEQVDSAGEDGVYDFQFSGVPGGETYVIYAGTDPNNDDLICDNGEACGAYISLDQPAELTVTGDMSGLDFMTDINIALPEVSTSRFAEAALPLQRKVLKGVAEGPDQNSRLLTRISPP